MKIGKKFGDRIDITWIDTVMSLSTWIYPKSISADYDSSTCFTRAWFVKEDKDFVHISHTKGKTENETVSSPTQIPKSCIIKVK